MSMNELLTLTGGVMLSIISYFLKQTMDDLKETKLMSFNTKSQLEILKNDHENKYEAMTEKFDELRLALRELTKEVSNLNKILASK